MNKELKIYRLVNKIMTYSKGKVDYADAYSHAKRFYDNKPFGFGWFSHVGDNYIAHELSKRLAK